ncbi:MAG: histidine--tRNA ligase [Rickettsiales bacterium]|jgi:histidyl-tRNA synthetase|nr:histidine--tRNA ligase [Rickettsiales bacterium]
MNNHKIQAVRGTKDLFGIDIARFNHIIENAKKYSRIFGFQELQTPIFEFSEIFERNLGDNSDIINKEVYKFLDRGNNHLTLRPEFTASIVRAIIENSQLTNNLPVKLFSYGPLFRYDRPQKGRQRQFHQINFECFGDDSVFCDVQNLILANKLLQELGVKNNTKLIINSLGSNIIKNLYQEELIKFFSKYQDKLSEDSRSRLHKNPLRILDSKDQQDIKISLDAPKIKNFFDDQSKSRFDKILNLLTIANIDFEVDYRLVRGLDYYNSTVFEFINNHQGAQNAVLAGGRYDNLSEQMGGKNLPAFGFAGGIERIMIMIEENNQFIENKSRPIIVIYIGEEAQNLAFKICCELRENKFYTEFLVSNNFKKQLKFATQINAKWVIIIGENEIKNQELIVKNFDEGKESKITNSKIVEFLQQNQQ